MIQMTDAEIIRHVAGKLGWRIFDYDLPASEKPDSESGPVPSISELYDGRWWALLKRGQWSSFNPLEKLDDVKYFEAALPEEKRWEYVMELRELVDPEGDSLNARTCTALVYATDRQKCLALVATL